MPQHQPTIVLRPSAREAFSPNLSHLPIERLSGWLKFLQGFVQTVALFGCIAATTLLWQLYFA